MKLIGNMMGRIPSDRFSARGQHLGISCDRYFARKVNSGG